MGEERRSDELQRFSAYDSSKPLKFLFTRKPTLRLKILCNRKFLLLFFDDENILILFDLLVESMRSLIAIIFHEPKARLQLPRCNFYGELKINISLLSNFYSERFFGYEVTSNSSSG